MLREIRIQDIAIIDELTLRLRPGLNVLSGETGAGKSILVEALDLVLGARAPENALREGAKSGLIEAQFTLNDDVDGLQERLRAEDLLDEEEPKSLTLARSLRRGGRSSARVNGFPVALTILRDIAAELVDIHGQSEHLSLLRPAQHLGLLDRYAKLDDERRAFTLCLSNFLEMQKARAAAESQWVEAQRDRERWQASLDELEAVALREGEEHELRIERERLGNREQLAELTTAALNLLIADERADALPMATDALARVAALLSRLAALDAAGEGMATLAARLDEEANELVAQLLRYRDQLEYEPRRLEEIEERLELIRRCLRNYGGSVTAALAHEAAAREALMQADSGDAHWRKLAQQEQEQLLKLGRAAEALSAERAAAAARLSAAVQAELALLGMSGARFAVEIAQQQDETGCPLPDGRVCRYGRQGIDQVRFTLSANPGEALRPLVQVASGGETARIMLALKSVLAEADKTPTQIFDEIDQGIGGRLGAVLGGRLRALSATGHQVLVITHLAQLAAFADAHFVVVKAEVDSRTVTRLHELQDDEARIAELAAMLGAETKAGRLNAAELLARAAARA